MRHTLTRRPRRGFTLVELLVACALTVLIMAVLATAFQAGLKTFSHLKSTVGLSEQLRSAEQTIRRDLEATHLENAEGLPIRVSDFKATSTRGYLEIIQPSAPKQNYSSSDNFYDMSMTAAAAINYPYVIEGSEDKVTSGRATDHSLFFTAKLRGNSTQEVFLGVAPSQVAGQSLTDFVPAGSAAGTIATEWAEVGYFLKFSNVMTISDDPAVAPLRLFTLHRVQKLLTPSATPLPLLPAAGGRTNPADWVTEFPEASISTQPRPLPTNPFAGVNDPGTVSQRSNRWYVLYTNGTTTAPTTTPTFNAAPASGVTKGTDILVTNVVSMQIRTMDSSGKYQDVLPNLAASPLPKPAPAVCSSFDTASPGTAQVRAIQIRLRVYDTKNHLTRQMTMTFDL